MAIKNFAANLKIGATMGSSVGRVFGAVKSKIKEQESTLKKLRAAYKDASKGTGEYAGKLDQLQKEIDQTERKLKALKAAMGVGAAGKKFGSAFMADTKRLAIGAGIATAAIAAVGGAVFTTTKGFVDWADDIGDSAEALQMSTQALQTWQFAAATVGVGGSKMTASIARFSKAISEGSDATNETLAKLGVNGKRLAKLGLDEQLEVIAEAFKDYKGTDRAAVAMKLFGRSGYQLAGILAKGKKGLDEFRKAGEETGAVLDDDAAEAAGRAASALDMFGITMVGLRNTIAIQFVPTLTRLSERFSQFIRDNGPQIREWATKFAALIERNVVPAIGKLLDKMPSVVENFASMASKIFAVADAIQSFLGGWDNLGIAIVALNFAPTIIALGRLVKTVWGLGAAVLAITGPIGLMIGAVAALGLAVWDLSQENSKIYKWLSEMFPNAMRTLEDVIYQSGEKIKSIFIGVTEAITGAFTKMFDWVTSKFDWFVTKAAELGSAINGFFGGEETPAPGPALRGGLKGPPKGFGKETGALMPADAMPNATSSVSQNNNFNINVNAPGADGRRIADQLRNEFNRKPLFDSDGALAPG